MAITQEKMKYVGDLESKVKLISKENESLKKKIEKYEQANGRFKKLYDKIKITQADRLHLESVETQLDLISKENEILRSQIYSLTCEDDALKDLCDKLKIAEMREFEYKRKLQKVKGIKAEFGLRLKSNEN